MGSVVLCAQYLLGGLVAAQAARPAARAARVAIARSLRRERGMRFSDIARALGRDPRNINSTYRRGAA